MTPLGESLSRRQAMGWLAGLGITSATFARALAVEAERTPISAEAIANAEWVSGVTLSEQQREQLVRAVDRTQQQLEQLRAVKLDADISPSLVFETYQDGYLDHDKTAAVSVSATASRVELDDLPTEPTDIAFASISVLGTMLRKGKISSVELTQLVLDRLQRHGPTLNCIVTLTPELALRQAETADQELAAGTDRGPLHGIPWGAKDLIAVAGYKTTWGAEAYKDQVREETATVARKLESAGAVMVAKLSLGAIAMGDDWFGGRTLNPWNLEQGSSGSSAGSAAATAAGLVPFAIGSETLGSIVSPSRRCGTTGLRPTFGRVSRAGCMPLAWSFDKIGPICRSVEDCALVFAAIQGSDGRDPTVVNHSFRWPANTNLSDLKIGYTGEAGDDRSELRVLRELGVQLIPIELPDDSNSGIPVGALTMMLNIESASMFYELWKDGNEEGLFRWPRSWQNAAFVSAIDYIRASRVRTLLMQKMDQVMQPVDLYVGGNDLVLTNLTGHPTVVMPYRRGGEPTTEDDVPQAGPGQPNSITFTGRLHREADLMLVAQAFQNATGDHLPRPPNFNA